MKKFFKINLLIAIFLHQTSYCFAADTKFLAFNLTSVFSKSGKKKVVQKNDKIKISFVGTFNDGTVFDESIKDKPYEIIAGTGQMIPQIDEAVIGMKINEEKKIKIKAKDAFGERDENLVQSFPRDIFAGNAVPTVGGIVAFQDANGNPVSAPVSEVTEDSIIVDLNHPLAGKDLNYKIKIVDIE